MAEHSEAIVLSLIERMNDGDDKAVRELFAENAVYHVNAWHEPLTGANAISSDFERQHALWSNLRIRVRNIASTGNVVFTERIDTVHMMERDVQIHMVGVFEIDSDDKISNWRDYFDMKEIETQLAG